MRRLQWAIWTTGAILAALGTGCNPALEDALVGFASGGIRYDGPPEAFRESYTTFFNEPLLVSESNGVLVNDVGVEILEDFTSSTAQGGFVDLHPDGSFSYSPPPDFLGADYFDYRVENPEGEATGRVTIKIVPPDAVPVP